jgi:hypothetical protein
MTFPHKLYGLLEKGLGRHEDHLGGRETTLTSHGISAGRLHFLLWKPKLVLCAVIADGAIPPVQVQTTRYASDGATAGANECCLIA